MTLDDHMWLRAAIDLSNLCPVSESAFAVGAFIIGPTGLEISRGYSRETDSKVHAEESALAKITDAGMDLSTATIYSSLEPCSFRKSRPLPCSQLIIASGIRRVVIAMREPPLFEYCNGVEELQEAGIDVIEIPDLATLVWDINAHVLGDFGSR